MACCWHAFVWNTKHGFVHKLILPPVQDTGDGAVGPCWCASACSTPVIYFNKDILPPVQDTVIGKIYFLLVRIKLKHMEIEIRRRETIGSGSNARNESETLAKYEIMDGAPVRGENIPIRWACMGSMGTGQCRGQLFPCCSAAAVHCGQCQ